MNNREIHMDLDLLLSNLVDIVNDDAALKLAAELNRFNVFSILKINDYEIRHANVLAWLLDPTANHGLGETFLRSFISRLPANQVNPNLARRFELAVDRTMRVKREVQTKDLKKSNFFHSSQEVSNSREENRQNGAIDILLEGQSWILAIETKIRASESDGQLKKYREALEVYAHSKQEFEPKIELFYLFLTMDDAPPSDKKWGSVNWREHVVAPLEATLSIHTQINSKVKHFLESYVETLKRYLGESEIEVLADSISREYSPQLTNLKKYKEGTNEDVDRIYKRHSAIFDLLCDRLESTQRLRAEHIKEVISNYGFKAITENATYISFIPTAWEKSFPVMMNSRKDVPRIAFEITNRFPDIKIKLMTPGLGESFKDEFADARRKFVSMVQESRDSDTFNTAFNKAKQPRTPTDFYNSVFCESHKIDSDTEDSADEFIKKTLDLIKAKLLPKVDELMRKSEIS